jgi:tetratricopeptide (TPR) repeat protein
MNPGATQSLDLVRAEHRIATNRSLQALLAWGAETAAAETSAGRRVLWAPCHAISGAVSLRSWILERAGQELGAPATSDAPTLLSGAADVLMIADPMAADSASLHWLSDLLACAETAREVAATPPLPELIVLAQTGSSTEHSDGFLDRLRAMGAREARINGRETDLSVSAIDDEVKLMRDRYETLLAVLALLPCPIDLEDFAAFEKASGAGGALKALTAGGLFQVIDNDVVPSSREVRPRIRAALGKEVLQHAAVQHLNLFEQRLETLPDARIEVLMLSGDVRRATRLARKRFDEHYAAGQYEEALRVVELAQQLEMPLEAGRHAAEVDQAKTAAMHAEVGNHDKAKEMVGALARRRDLYRTAAFVEWLALAARTLAMKVGHEPRNADSLMRRAIRLIGDDLDRNVRMTILRVQLLESSAFTLDDRATWLLSHINNKMLDEVSLPTLAVYLEETASRLAARDDYKGAFKRLRRLAAIETSDHRKARAMLLMARCRQHFDDHEGAMRYAAGALQYGLRAADPDVVEGSVKFLREADRARPRALPRIAPVRPRTDRPRLPAAADILAPQAPDAARLFEILQSRFGAMAWLRRRGSQSATFGRPAQADPETLTVFSESSEGSVSLVVRGSPGIGGIRGLVLLRADGDDVVIFAGAGEREAREDAIVRFLLADRVSAESRGSAEPPSRKNVVDEYLRRAHAHGTERGLHATMETLFNKDLLMYLEEQGLTKEEMAERLGVSRATLYRMFARAGLN